MKTDQPEATWSLATASARRSLILCAAGAVAGLAIAGLGLFTAQGTRTAGVAPENVATVNAVPILMADYVTQLRALYDIPLSQATPAQKRQVLDDMIREELYVQRGVELGMQSDTIEVRQALVGAVEAQAAADAAAARPDDATLRDYYRRNPGKFAGEGAMTLDEYILPQTADPAAVLAGLRADGVGPAQVARFGLKRTDRMTDGEEFYFAARIHLGDALFAIARRLRDGEVSTPIAQRDGRHILVMRRNRPPALPPFDRISDRVLTDYIAAQKAVLIAGNERFLHKRADIQIQQGYR